MLHWPKWSVVVVVCALASSVFGAPLGAGFTYQGSLKKNGVAAAGPVHLRFSLWDVAGAGSPPIGGNQSGASQLVNNIALADGVFTVTLNGGGEFGANAFDGNARWLHIEVCEDANCATVTTLSPRQPVTAAPYSLGPWQSCNGSVSYTGGRVGIGTSNPSKTLTVDGDVEIGTNDADFQHIRLGGGNSSGFIFGSPPLIGDGISISYNYYSRSDANVIFNTFTGTSRITAGPGHVTIATDFAGQGSPEDRLVVEGDGDVRLGPNTSLYAASGDENLRMIRGVIGSTGSIITGSGFNLIKTGTGTYTVNFNTPFAAAPAVTATAHYGAIGFRYAMTDGVTTHWAKFVLVNSVNHLLSDTTFHFTAIGPR